MTLDKFIEKLTERHGIPLIIREIVDQYSLPKVVLELSNYCMRKANECRNNKNKKEEKIWKNRAKILHDIVEEKNDNKTEVLP